MKRRSARLRVKKRFPVKVMPRTGRMADCHPDRKHYANGQCRACYKRDNRRTSDANYEASPKAKARYERYNQTEAGRKRKREWFNQQYHDRREVEAVFGKERLNALYPWLKSIEVEGLTVGQKAQIFELADKKPAAIATKLGLDKAAVIAFLDEVNSQKVDLINWLESIEEKGLATGQKAQILVLRYSGKYSPTISAELGLDKTVVSCFLMSAKASAPEFDVRQMVRVFEPGFREVTV